MIEKNNDLPGFIETEAVRVRTLVSEYPILSLDLPNWLGVFFSFVFLPDFPVHSVQLSPEGGYDANTGCQSSA